MTGEGCERTMAARGPRPYADGIETAADDEGAIIDGIIAATTHAGRTVTEPDGRTARASTVKSTGLVKGVPTVLPDLAGPLRRGCLPSRAATRC